MCLLVAKDHLLHLLCSDLEELNVIVGVFLPETSGTSSECS